MANPKSPRAIEPLWVEIIATDWDGAADICSTYNDLTGAAAFRTCANRIRRAALLPEQALWSEEKHWTERHRG